MVHLQGWMIVVNPARPVGMLAIPEWDWDP